MPTKNSLEVKNGRFWIAVGWTLVVTVLCLVRLIGFPERAGSAGVDKIVHFVFHFVFTWLWFGYSVRKFGGRRANILAWVVAVSVVFGVLIEFAQEYLTENREADATDVLANFIGALIAALILYFSVRKSPSNK